MPMPSNDKQLQDKKGADEFCGINLCSSFWQAPIDEKRQPILTFMIPDGVVIPTCTPQGSFISVANFQEKSCDSLRKLLQSSRRGLMTSCALQIILRWSSKSYVEFWDMQGRTAYCLPNQNWIISKESGLVWEISDASVVRFNPSYL